MRIKIQRSELKEALSGLSKIVSRKTYLPMLKCLKFSTQDNLLAVTGTDLEQTVSYTFASAKIEDEGAIAVNFDALKPFAKGKNEDWLVLEDVVDAVAITNIVCGQSITERIAKFDPQEFPDNPPAVETKPVDEKFLEYFRKAALFVSADEARQMLSTVHLDASNKDHHCVVATDGRRLTCIDALALPINLSCNLKPTKFLTWPKLAGDIEIGVKKINDAIWFVLRNQHWTYQTKSLDGTYPNWRQVVPTEAGTHIITFSDGDALMLPKMLSWFAGNDQSHSPITLVGQGGDGRLAVYGYNNENRTWSKLELKESRYKGLTGLVTLNRNYLTDALQSGFRAFAFSNNHCPVSSDDGQGGKHILMQVTPMVPEGVIVEDPQAVEVVAQVA